MTPPDTPVTNSISIDEGNASSDDTGPSDGTVPSDGTGPSDDTAPGNGTVHSDEPVLANETVVSRSSIFRWIVLLSPLVIPWVVIRTNATTLLFPWGTVVVETGYFTLLTVFIDQPGPILPYLRYWLFATGCYVLALLWAATRPFGADQRVTAGLFVLVAISAAFAAAEFSVDLNRTGIPVASVHAFIVGIWVYLER